MVTLEEGDAVVRASEQDDHYRAGADEPDCADCHLSESGAMLAQALHPFDIPAGAEGEPPITIQIIYLSSAKGAPELSSLLLRGGTDRPQGLLLRGADRAEAN